MGSFHATPTNCKKSCSCITAFWKVVCKHEMQKAKAHALEKTEQPRIYSNARWQVRPSKAHDRWWVRCPMAKAISGIRVQAECKRKANWITKTYPDKMQMQVKSKCKFLPGYIFANASSNDRLISANECKCKSLDCKCKCKYVQMQVSECECKSGKCKWKSHECIFSTGMMGSNPGIGIEHWLMSWCGQVTVWHAPGIASCGHMIGLLSVAVLGIRLRGHAII